MTNTQKQTIIDMMSKVTSQEVFAGVLEYIATDVLGYRKWYTLNQIRSLATGSKSLYRKFTIPKKSGGVRTITAPCYELKAIQESLNVLFQTIYEPSKQAYGFVVGKSVADNAAYHVGQRYVFNIDLKDFFPSIEKRRVIGRLLSKPFSFPKDVAFLVAGLACAKISKDSQPVLPQGSPVSPTFSNIIADRLDRKLNKLANRYGARYSRYADDITFSSMNNIYRQEGDFYNAVCEVVAEEGFTINELKVRLNRIGERLEITGLTVSDKVNVTRKYINDLRWMIYHWERDGYNGAYKVFLEKYVASKTTPVKGTPNMEHVIAGKLDYLKMVKGEVDGTFLKLKERFNALVKGQPIDKSVSAILDIWEKDGIDAAMEEYYYKSSEAATEETVSTPAYDKFSRLEKYSIDAFCSKYGASFELKVLDDKLRAFVNNKPSFNGHPIYVAKSVDENDKNLLIELIQSNKARVFWYVSVNRFEKDPVKNMLLSNTVDESPLNRLPFKVKPIEPKADNKAIVEPTVKLRALFFGDNKTVSIIEQKQKYEIENYCLSGRLSYLWNCSLLSVDFVYPDSLAFCAAECVVINNDTKETKTIMVTPRKLITEAELSKLKEYHASNRVIDDLEVRIGKHKTSTTFGSPKWTEVSFCAVEGNRSDYVVPSGAKYTHIFKDARVSIPTAKAMEDFKIK